MQVVITLIGHICTALLLVGHAVLAFFTPHPRVETATPPPSTYTGGVQTTLPTTIAATTSSATFPSAKNKNSSASTAAAKLKKVVVPAQKSSGPLGNSPAAGETVSIPLPPPLPQSVVNDAARAALVNVLCTTKSGGYLNPISGSGVMIAGSGIVLTNAHVAQYFLLRDYLVPGNVTCVIRTGSPATPKYKAELLYLPPSWIAANAAQITADEGTGTGENDYAFLRITGTTDPNGTLPKSFPYMAMTTDYPARDESVLLAAYPAGYLEGITIEMSLYITSALTSIGEIYAFDGDDGFPDVVAVGSTIVSQAGASGGAVVRMQDAALQALVATASAGDTTSSRTLNAITLSHIDRSLRAAGKGGIAALLTGDLKQKAADFAQTIALDEIQQLTKVLKK